MVSDPTHFSKKYIFWAIEILLIGLSLFLLKPFIIPLVSAFILAFLTKPLYSRLVQRMPRSLAAFICIFLVALIIVIPLALALNVVLEQAHVLLKPGAVDAILTQISGLPFLRDINLDAVILKQEGVAFLVGILTASLKSIPSFVLELLVAAFGMFYILLHWDALARMFTSALPFPNKKALSEKIANATKGIVYGYVVVALIEFVIASIGFSLSGAPFAILLAAIIALFAFIPGLGPAAVWVPMVIYHFVMGSQGTAIGVLITGLIISIGIDQFVAPAIVGRSAKIHPFVMLLGVLGGIPLFGIFGFIIGPLILVYAIRLLREAVEQKVY